MEQKPNGALIGSFIIIIILILGGIYFWKASVKKVTPPPFQPPAVIRPQQKPGALIESQVNDIDLNNLDKGL